MWTSSALGGMLRVWWQDWLLWYVLEDLPVELGEEKQNLGVLIRNSRIKGGH